MQVDLKDIMLSDISLTDVDKYHRSHLYLESRKQTRKKQLLSSQRTDWWLTESGDVGVEQISKEGSKSKNFQL